MNKNKRDKILIVDDEEAVRELLALNLSDLYDADTADSVKEAVKKIELSKYALVITDMKMPGGNGLDLIKLIKEKSPETIVIAITGFSSVEDAISALKLGAEEYVLKPLDFDKFNVIVKSLIEKYRLRKKLSIIRRSFELEKLNRIVLESEDISKTLPEILDLICRMFQADSGSVMLYDKTSQKLCIIAAKGMNQKETDKYEVSIGERVSGWVAENKKAVKLGSNVDKFIFKNFEPRGEIRSSIVVPLSVHEKLMGVLNLNMLEEGKVFSDEDLDILSMFSLSLALSMENAMFKNELIESNERLKEIDKLKTELISNVSHELRTPLTAMKGSLDLMLFHSAEPTEEAKKLLIESIYLTKMSYLLQTRLADAESLLQAYTKRLETGDVNLLEVNKSKLYLLHIQNQVKTVQTELKSIQKQLIYYNGGQELNFDLAEYPQILEINADEITIEKQNNDPELLYASKQIESSAKMVKVTRNLQLPKFSMGYAGETVADEKFRGVVIGLSVPLWSGNSAVKKAKFESQYLELSSLSMQTKIETETKAQIDKIQSLKKNLDNYSQTLSSVNNIELLKKSLELGEISSIEYFTEISYFYQIYDDYLISEKEYQLAVCEMLQFKL